MDEHQEPYPASVVEDAGGRLWENVAETHRPGLRNWRREGTASLHTWSEVNKWKPLRARLVFWQMPRW